VVPSYKKFDSFPFGILSHPAAFCKHSLSFTRFSSKNEKSLFIWSCSAVAIVQGTCVFDPEFLALKTSFHTMLLVNTLVIIPSRSNG